MWEPFTQSARHAIVRAQEVAQMFASNYIGTEHIAFALAEGDDDLGRLMTNTIDREQLRDVLGGAARPPQTEMVFTTGAKRAIELSFENARRLNHNSVAAAHLGLGILAEKGSVPLRPDVDLERVRAELDAIAAAEIQKNVPHLWRQTSGPDDPPPATRTLLDSLHYFPPFSLPGTRVTVSIEPPKGKTRTWTWEHQQPEES